MALATTSAVWRSTGGDQTRTAFAGSMEMVAQFYIANVAATGNVVVSSLANAAALILPANAVVTSVSITNAVGGNATANVGYTPLVSVGPGQTTTLGTNVPAGLLSAANVSARVTIAPGSTGQGTALGNACNATNLVVVTTAAGGANAGAVSGYIKYFVVDGIYGQQNV
jgi:hypothetical protein